MEKRKLKHPYKRVPKEKLMYSSLRKNVSKETGYPIDKVDYILKTFLENVRQGIFDKKSVILPEIGILYAGVRAPKISVNFNNKKNLDHHGKTLGYKGMEVIKRQEPANWALKFKAYKSMREKVKAMEVTEEQLNDIYED